MRIDVLTTFPRMFDGPLDESILKRARERGLVEVRVHDLRGWTTDRHRTTDDAPYGGGAGMVMRPEPVFAAAEALLAEAPPGPGEVILLTPQGQRFDQAMARRLSEMRHLLLLCGHYEGFDERIRERLATRELSIGDYVLTGGELPALVLIDAVARLQPGVLGSDESLDEESHSHGLLEYPHYTRPPDFRGWEVPPVLLSGNHGAIARWRREQSLARTLERRPDLLAAAELSSADRRFLAEHGAPEYLRPEDVERPRRRRRRVDVPDG
ncbi:MAG TPA: tRNA (guanosine(37)-N1)-methyltransferase TrmD [Chloroflexota bacterium]|jgi:tRNA (guanine37-N1)-methyltransferase